MRLHPFIVLPVLVGATALAPGCRSAPRLPPDADGLHRALTEAAEGKRTREARRAIAAFRKQFPGDRRMEEVRFLEVDILFEAGKVRSAVNETREVLKEYPLSKHLPALERRLFTTGIALLEGDGGGFLGIRDFLAIEPDGIEILGVLLENFRKGAYADAAQRKIALWAMDREDYDRAILEFDRLRKDYPESEWRAVADFNVAQCKWLKSRGSRYDGDIIEKAREEYQKYVDLHPEGTKVAEAQSRIRALDDRLAEKGFLTAEFYRTDDRPEAARLYYKIVMARYPETPWAARSGDRIRTLPGGAP